MPTRILLCALLAGACYVDDYGPGVAYVSPGVAVVTENAYDDPVFYSSECYWRYRDGVWLRSEIYESGWAVAAPPAALLTLRDPAMYAGYHRHYHSGQYGDPTGYLSTRGGLPPR